MVPLIRQCAGTVPFAATGATELMTVFGTGRAELGKDAALHATVGALALAILSVATARFSFFVSNSSKVLMPGCKPNTVPVIAPGSLGESAEVTSLPFSLTAARRMTALDPALTLI